MNKLTLTIELDNGAVLTAESDTVDALKALLNELAAKKIVVLPDVEEA